MKNLKTIKEADIERIKDIAKGYEMTCTGCAQSTVAALLKVLDIKSEEVFKAASGLADGIGLSSDGSCGALTGGAMVMGLVFGRRYEDFKDPLAAIKSYDLAKELHEHFISEYGTCRCADIQKKLMGRSFNLRNPDDATMAMEQDMSGHCSDVVGRAAAMVLRIIASGASNNARTQVSCGGSIPTGCCGGMPIK
jgi:C_GCAxxG_C_C family probable redox protein